MSKASEVKKRVQTCTASGSVNPPVPCSPCTCLLLTSRQFTRRRGSAVVKLLLVRRLGNHNMPRATFRFYPDIPGWVDSDALSDSRRCARIGAKPHEYKKKTGGLSCPKFGW